MKHWANYLVHNRCHFGNRSTNRVESSHGAFKKQITSSSNTTKITTDKINQWFKRRNEESDFLTVKESLSCLANIKKQSLIYEKLKVLVGKVYTFAIKAIFNELILLKSKPTTYSVCNCACRVQYKIPCVHLLSLVPKNDTIPLSMVPRRRRIRYDEGEFDDYFQSQMISIEDDSCITETILLDYINKKNEEEMKSLPSSDLNNPNVEITVLDENETDEELNIPSNDIVDSAISIRLEEFEKLQSLTSYTEASQNSLTP
ncbi:MAG: hypothetical protein EXX96DRAFT_105901 [Benjaminiella poitrasii]|nr:MAG: hypothetical protein EXX96DRAFT_105901 [Benjaminiella poitrasii]